MPEETKPPVFNPPDRIYLQVVGTDEKADIAEVHSKPFDHFAEISWCSDKINDSDLEYKLVTRRRLRRETECQKGGKRE